MARGRGVSYTKYEPVRTYVGIVADVTVDRTTGQISVDRVFVAHDCGQIINPDGLRNQIEGSVVQTLSRTLVEKLTFSRSAVTSLDWASYPILTFPNVPEIAIDLIDRPDRSAVGRGRADHLGRALGNLECRIRRDRRAAAIDAIQPDKVLAALSAREVQIAGWRPCRQSMIV